MPLLCFIDDIFMYVLQKEWRESREEFKRKVARCVKRSQETAWDWLLYAVMYVLYLCIVFSTFCS